MQSRTHHLRRERRVAKTHTSGIEYGVCNRSRAWHRRRFTRTQWVLQGARHLHDFNHRHLLEIQNRITAPLRAGHAAIVGIGLHVFKQGAARGLQHIAMHLVFNAFRVDDATGVMPDHDAFDLHFARGLMHLHVSHPSGPCRAKTWPFAVRVTGVGNALALQPFTLGVLLLRACVWLPTCFVSGGLQHFTCTLI